MKDIISKELLSEVIKAVKGLEFDRFQQNEHWIGIERVVDGLCYGTNYNIHYVAHMCKEWAISLGYSIFTGYIYNDDEGTWCKCDVSCFTPEEEKYIIHFYDESNEVEAIFKACQYILDTKETK